MKEVLDYNVVPEHYKLKIDINEEHFEGEEEVFLTVKQKTKRFNFNEEDLELNDLKIYVNEVEQNFTKDIENSFVTIEFRDCEVDVNDKLRMCCKFRGEYSKDMWGFYKSTYNGDDLYSTDFEPTNARRAFPCWDQPDLKATFDIAIKPVDGYVALSNSSLKEIKDGYYYFNTTPKMSTYIVAYISGKLEPLTRYTKRNIPISVYSHKDEKDWGLYAAEVAVECLEFFEEYFAIDYPLPKLDLVTIPTFVSGAMENWGLVTFRKTSLLYEKETTSIRSKKRIAETVCHELAHMWFGNLVTMIWWNDLWLNEGFATWASYLAMSKISKRLVDWDVWTEFIVSDIESGMNHDCLNSSHPIAVNVNKPSEISQIFDTISYSKGASMIRMLEGFIGQNPFRDGIRTYLNKFKYSNASTNDLWDSFDESLHVKDLMEDWINKTGFPILEVKDTSYEHLTRHDLSRSDQPIGDSNKFVLNIEQSRFLQSGDISRDIWKIPLKIRWYDVTPSVDCVLMVDKEILITKQAKLYKLNDGATGFFRVKYPIENLTALFEIEMNTSNKLNLINDLFALISANQTPALDGIIISEIFTEEKNPEILGTILSNIAKIRGLFHDEKRVVKHLNEVIFDLVGRRCQNIDLTEKDVKTETAILNSLILSYGLSTGSKQIKEKLAEGFELFEKGKYINPEYIRPVFCSVADSKFDELWDIAKTSTLPDEKVMALSSLAYLQKENMLERMFELYPEIEPHNSIYFFLYLSSNYRQKNYVIDYIMTHFDEIRIYMKNDRLFQYVVENVLGCTSSHKQADKVIDLLYTKRGGEITMAIDKSIEKIRHNMTFRKFNDDLVKEKE
ncbi:hypothetical protein P3W45_001615 [Vairimorpha bombi]|jgi:puromycin-sensitive aminopeptidase